MSHSTDQEARRTLRLTIPGVMIAIDAPKISDRPWMVDAIDISSGGLGLVLPQELEEGTLVELSFKLGDEEFSRVPARVRYQLFASGGVEFEPWPAADRTRLLEYLVAAYEEAAR